MSRYTRPHNGGHQSGGFTNSRTGKYVSPARAHQHVGQSFGGYTKTRSKATGNYYMSRNGKRG